MLETHETYDKNNTDIFLLSAAMTGSVTEHCYHHETSRVRYGRALLCRSAGELS